MAQLTVGLDLGNESLKRVRLKSSFRSVEVVDYTRVELPQDDRLVTERMAEALGKLQGDDPTSDLLATALPGDVVTVRTIQLPFSDSKRIQQTIGFELEGQIPFSLDKVVYDYLRLAKTPEGTRMLAAICQIEQLERWLTALKSSGRDPRLLGADCLAYASLAEYLPTTRVASDDEEDQEPNPGRVAIVDIGHRLTSVCVLGPGGVEFGRTLSGGGADMTARLAEAFKVDPGEAATGKRQGVSLETESQPAMDPEQVMISDALRASVDVVVRELRQTLATHRSVAGAPVDKVWLCGGGAAVRNLDTYLAEELGVEVEYLRPDHLDLEGIDKLCAADDPECGVSWVKALGLALHAHQGGRRGWLNLRRGPFAFKGDFTAMRGKVLQVAAALIILALLAVGNALVHYFSMRATDQTLDDRIKETTQAILGKPYENVDKALAIINEKINPEETATLPQATALDGLFEVHDRIPKELKVRFKDINISPARIRVEGYTDTFDSVEKIKAAIQKYECFTEVKTGRTRRTRNDDEVEFELTIVNDEKC